jgi:FixJ family two-component response regulator
MNNIGRASEQSQGGLFPGGNAAEEKQQITVAVLDDDPAVLRSIGRLLARERFEVRLFASPLLLLSEIASLKPSCLIADLAMPGLSGLDVQRMLAARGISCSIIFITGHGDIRTSVQAMRGGAIDFLTKPFDSEELLDALSRAVARSASVRETDDQRTLVRRRVASLTPREREVFEYVVTGLLNKQIAARLDISEKTVKVHRGRVMRKMSVRSVAQLVRAAEQAETRGTGF